MHSAGETVPPSFVSKWWIYQKERFRVFQHAPLVFVFSFSGLCYSSLLRGVESWPALGSLLCAFFIALFFFMQLRIADEFKDFEEDSRYRPYRPVPRGLVTLPELGVVFVVLALLQLLLTALLHPPLIAILAIAWVYLAGMSKEFFLREWLVARPIVYLLTHMGIMPLIDLFITSCDWRVAGLSWPSSGIYWFLVVSFFNGILIEFGRKIRAPRDEEEGVRTYSAIWGPRAAAFAWLGALFLNGMGASLAAKNIGFLRPAVAILSALFLTACWIAFRYLRQPSQKSAQRIELYSGIWTLLMYLCLGPLSLGLEMLTR